MLCASRDNCDKSSIDLSAIERAYDAAVGDNAALNDDAALAAAAVAAFLLFNALWLMGVGATVGVPTEGWTRAIKCGAETTANLESTDNA